MKIKFNRNPIIHEKQGMKLFNRFFDVLMFEIG